MAQYVKKIRTDAGDLQIDYNALANLPKTDTTLEVSGKAADAKAVGDAITKAEGAMESMVKTVIGDQIEASEERMTSLVKGAVANHGHALSSLGLQYGSVVVECTTNTVSKTEVLFEYEYASKPIVVVTANSDVIGSYVKEVGISDVTVNGFNAVVYRGNDTATRVYWIAVGQLA